MQTLVNDSSAVLIDQQSFLQAAVNKSFLSEEEKMQSLFEYFDTDRKGEITIQNIVSIYARAGCSITVSEVKKMLNVLIVTHILAIRPL